MNSSLDTKTTDKTVRVGLVDYIRQHYDDSLLLEEFEVVRGRARADIVSIFDNKLHAFEIKSDVDTLLRLPSQIKYYNQVFSTITLVVGRQHVVKALYVIPDWWGVIVAALGNEDMVLSPIRDAKTNPNLNYNSVSDLLHRDELIRMLKKHAPEGRYHGMSKPKLLGEVRKRIGTDLLLNCYSDFISYRSLNKSCR